MLLLFILAACSRGSDTEPPRDTGPLVDPGEDTDDPGDGEREPPELISVEAGATCPPAERMGQVLLWDDRTGVAIVTDAPNPLVGPATVSGDDCVFYEHDAAACGGCPSGQLCSGEAECVDVPRTYKSLVLSGSSGDDTLLWEAEQQTGIAYGDALETGSSWDLTLSFAGLSVDLPTLQVAPPLEDLEVSVEVDEDWSYGALDIAWAPSDAEALVITEIPINHHAVAGTFTACQGPSEAGAMHASAEQIAPLAVHTGLEFQGIWHVQAVSVHTTRGCVEVLAGHYEHASATEVVVD